MRDSSDLLNRAAGLLVDLDGTLVDSTAAVQRAWGAFAARHGLDPAVVIATAHGKPSRETVQRLAPAEAHDREAQAIEQAEVHDTDGLRALPGALEILTCPGKRIALVTSCSTALATARLRAAGLPLPPITVTSDDVIRGKPDPEPFRLGAERLQLPPHDCLAFEDTPAGIASAKGAGIPVIALRTTYPESELTGADAVLDDLSALFKDA